jgi:isopenicillin N synthase-like dioxygenase
LCAQIDTVTRTLPIVDVAALRNGHAGDRPTASSSLVDALSRVGFAVIVNHGVADRTIADMRRAVGEVFSTPRELLAERTVRKGNYRGYVPLGFFTPNSGTGAPDQYEAWKLHFEVRADDPIRDACELYAPNVWPPTEQDVRAPILRYWDELELLCNDLLTALCEAMEINVESVLQAMESPLTNMTLLNYPPTTPTPDTWGIHPHKDFNVLTVLAHDSVGGLEVRDRNGDWIDAACPEEAMVVNVGDMLELWTGGRLVSTPHRVVNRSGRQRQSFPFFCKPRWDVIVEPLLPPVSGFDRLPLHVGTSAADIWYSNWPDTASSDPAQVLGNYR